MIPVPVVATPKVAALVLAGGQSRRMGRDKALEELAGRTLLSRGLDRLRPQADALAVSGGRRPGRLCIDGLPVLPDGDGDGPLAGVLAGLDWAAALGARVLLTSPVDTPFLPDDLAARLVPVAPAYAAGPDRPHPLLAAWPILSGPALRTWLRREEGSRAVMAFCERIGAVPVRWESEAPFRNLNTPDDLLAAEASIKGGR